MMSPPDSLDLSPEMLEDLGYESLAAVMREQGTLPLIPWWYGGQNCIRSIFCQETASGEICDHCNAVAMSKKVNQFAKRTAEFHARLREAGTAVPSDFKGREPQNAGHTELQLQVKVIQGSVREHHRTKHNLTRTVTTLRSRMAELKAALTVAQANPKKLPTFVDNFIQAFDDGIFHDKAALEEILTGISENLIKKPQGRRYDSTARAFYLYLLNHGGPVVHDFVAKNLGGPDIRTTKVWRSSSYQINLGPSGIPGGVKHAAEMLRLYGCEGVPCLVGEDGTALQAKVEALVQGKECRIYGFCGEPKVVRTVQDVQKLFAEQKLATTCYCYTLIPLVEGGPAIIIGVLAHDNSNETFSKELIDEIWNLMYESCEKEGICLLGHVSDGDSRLRNADLRLGMGTNGDRLSLCHPLLQMSMVLKGGSYVLATQDWLHILWRLRVQFLDPRKYLKLGPFTSNFRYLRRVMKEHPGLIKLLYKDLDYKNKQDFYAALRLADIVFSNGKFTARSTREEGSLRALLREEYPEYTGSLLFLEFMHRFASIFVLDLSVEQCIEYAAWCITFAGRWHQAVLDKKRKAEENSKSNKKYSLKMNFLTWQTYQDVIIACNNVILAALAFKRLEDEGKRVEWRPSRISSRFVEYEFAFFREGNQRLTALTALQRCRIKDSQIVNEVGTKLQMPNSKRLAPVNMAEGGSSSGDGSAVAAAFPGPERIIGLMNKGREGAENLLQQEIQVGHRVLSVWSSLYPESHAVESMTLLVAPATADNNEAGPTGVQELEKTYEDDAEHDMEGQFDDGDAVVASTRGEESGAGAGAGAENEDEVDAEVDPRLAYVFDSLNALHSNTGDLQQLPAIRRELALFNSRYVPQKLDRTRGRFHGVEVRDGVEAGDDDDGYLSDEDCVAVPFEVGGSNIIEYGIIEGMSGESSSGKGNRKDVPRASINDPSVQVYVKFFEEITGAAALSRLPADVKEGAAGRRIFRLELDPRDGIIEVSMKAVLAEVRMENFKEEGKFYFLNKDDETEAREVYNELFPSGKRAREAVDPDSGPSNARKKGRTKKK